VANSRSALKRIRVAERNRLRNKSYKSAIATLTKKYFNAVEAYASEPSPEKMTEVQQAMSAVYSKIDKAVKRDILHKNNGARKKSRLDKRLKQVSATAA
jgi:small subunit ribosomal protein S20